MADLKNKIFNYLTQRHFDLMPVEVRARFDEFSKNNDFQGNMQYWKDHFAGSPTPDLVGGAAASTGVPNENQLTNDEWGELYDAYREVFERMDVEKIPPVGYASEYKKATKDFIANWFGDDKIFTPTQATGPATAIFTDLADFLDIYKAKFKPFARSKDVPQSLKEAFSGIDYDKFIDKLRSGDYNKDTRFRDKVLSLIDYIIYNGPKVNEPVKDDTVWPREVGYDERNLGDGTFLVDNIRPEASVVSRIYANPDTSTWFKVNSATRTANIEKFKGLDPTDLTHTYTDLFDTLLTKSKIREHFLGQASNPIVTEPLNQAIAQTDYENKDSKDYVPPKYDDEKNVSQRFEDFRKDTYEDYFRKFVNPSRGSRIFFSPWSQNIIKAFDKIGIKPTDGLEGILAKKTEILGKLKNTKNGTDHFTWFADTLEALKEEMPKAVEGALRNGAQMNALVSAMIARAAKNGKIAEAKTALEVLSVAKYGLSCSRTLNAVNEATKDMSILSDGNLSWNKNEGIQFVTKAMDKTAGFAIRGVAKAAAGINNFIQHRRTKIGKDIRKNKILNDAHRHWNEEDIYDTAKAKNTKATEALADLAAGRGKSGTHITDATTLSAAEASLAMLTPGNTAYDDLKADIDLYKASVTAQHDSATEMAKITQNQANRAADPDSDKIKELIAYWDMLESVTKSHAFTLGSMSVKRKALLKGWDEKTSVAQQTAKNYLATYGSLRTS